MFKQQCTTSRIPPSNQTWQWNPRSKWMFNETRIYSLYIYILSKYIYILYIVYMYILCIYIVYIYYINYIILISYYIYGEFASKPCLLTRGYLDLTKWNHSPVMLAPGASLFLWSYSLASTPRPCQGSWVARNWKGLDAKRLASSISSICCSTWCSNYFMSIFEKISIT